MKKPLLDNTPGLRWRQRNVNWEATWRARSDLVRAGFQPKNRLLWKGRELTPADVVKIQTECRTLQDEMLLWSRRGLPEVGTFTGTLHSLIDCYQTDQDSTFHKLRYHVRVRHLQMMRRIIEMYGNTELSQINARLIKGWHRDWMGGDNGEKTAAAHAFVGQLRTIFGFGFTLLEDKQCERLCAVMHKMRFPTPKPREAALTVDQVIAMREALRAVYPSIALSQALQFEVILRQKDCIGEWVPISEPGASDVTHPTTPRKWLRGLRWGEIDQNFILKHVTSKRDKELVVNLKLAPMILEEFALMAGVAPEALTRDMLPASGPVIVCEYSKVPWIAGEFRRKWRMVARAIGIPDEVRNMDSRAGGISEATGAGADIEHVRHAATHSSIQMTQRYSRQAQEKIAKVQQVRVASRTKKGTE